MRDFLIKLFKFFSLLLFLFVVTVLIYVYNDPFRVVRNYDPIIEEDGYNLLFAEINRDYINTVTLSNNLRKGKKYDSFIFGSSRSLSYKINEWKKYLNADAEAFHYDAAAENLLGMYKKIMYLSEQNIKIKNALFIFDHSVMPVKENKGHLYIKSPQIMGGFYHKLEFHVSFYKAFYSIPILQKIMLRLIEKDNREKIKNSYDVTTNEKNNDHIEKLIKEGKFYTKERKKVFYKRSDTLSYSNEKLTPIHKKYFEDIKNVFREQGTDYKIIINPLYDQVKMDTLIIQYLNKTFGKENVFDFSGKNAITDDFNNYYETSHFRPHVSSKILNKIYLK